MKTLIKLILCASLAGLLCTMTAAYGMQSPGYTLDPSGQNSGGGSRTAPAYSITVDAIGQSVAGGTMSSAGYSISGGLVPVMADVETDPPVSVITAPMDGETLGAGIFTITGTADDGTGSGVKLVEVSTNGGLSWVSATDSTGYGTWATWSYNWSVGSAGSHTIRSRAKDNAGNVESPGPSVTVTVTALGSPELQHYNWSPWLSGGSCTACHSTPSTFLDSGFRDRPGYCRSCHNAAAPAHEQNLAGSHEHGVMVNVTSGGAKMPAYGNITSGEYDNRPYAHLLDGDKVVCVTCHNPMRKSEDMGRVWEYTTTSDRLTYAMEYGGWSGYGELVPRVYGDSSLWAGPSYSKTKKSYLVDPSEYTYDEDSGSVTFAAQQDVTSYIYVTLDYPYLRASNTANTLCADCHAEATHRGANCLVCHSAHNTDNLGGVKPVVRTTGHTELPVVLTSYSGANSFADGDANYDGICEVCHTATLYHMRDGSGANHYDGSDCRTCHTHTSGFAR